MDLYIDNRTDFKLDDELIKSLQRCVDESIKVEECPDGVEVSLSFVTNEEIKELNNRYRNLNRPTDVLSFPQFEDNEDLDCSTTLLLGDIVISIDKSKEQAEEYGHSLKREICYLTIHSMFHLFGYDHMSLEDKLEMREKEKMVINNLSLTEY